MENLLYYPGFEIQDETWLKFALLYIDKLRPIIPFSGDRYLSDYTEKILNESDLLSKYRPGDKEALRATLDALDVLEKIMQHPERYSPVFSTSQIDSVWRNSKRYNSVLFRDKYTIELERFILNNKLGHHDHEGIRLSHSLARLYMTIFAQAISDSKKISPITDLPDMDKFSIFVRNKIQDTEDKFLIAHKIIELKLPNNIVNVSIDDILALRKKEDYKSRLRAFHNSLNEFLDSEDEDKSAVKFIDKHKHIYNEFNLELLQFGLGLSTIGVGIWILTQSPETSEGETVKSLLEIGSVAVSAISINKSWKNTKTKRYCKKYLADISSLKTR